MTNNRVLIVAASPIEVQHLLSKSEKTNEHLYSVPGFAINVDLLITGIGTTSMTYFLTKQLNDKKYNFALLVGIAGAYSQSFKLGDLVNVNSERFADMGIIKDDSFTDFFDMNLEDANKFPFENKILKNYSLINNAAINKLPTAKGNTVNSIRTNILPHIQQNTDVESMEGASFAFVCSQHPMAYAQIRAISNYVGQQDKKLWNISLAVKNLHKLINEVLIII